MNRTWSTMGTVASLTAPGGIPDEVAGRVEDICAGIDARFSLYRDDSELARIASGAARLEDSGPELRGAYASVLEWRERTEGAFTPHRPDGVTDLSGIVKALAMERSGEALDAAGIRGWMLGIGGDLLWASDVAKPSLGIVDPDDRRRLLTTLSPVPGRRALATSGSAERGEHIWSRADVPRTPYLQVSVAAADIVTADVLATAIIAGGVPTCELVCDRWDVDVLTVDRHGELTATPAMRTALSVHR